MQMSSFDLKLVMLAKQLPEDEDREETAGSRRASAMVAAPPPPHPPKIVGGTKKFQTKIMGERGQEQKIKFGGWGWS